MARRSAGGRSVWMFDSFEGLPELNPDDGSPEVFALAAAMDNCRADLADVEEQARRLGLSDQVHIVKGWFDETLPASVKQIGTIAVLRIDADLYRSVKACLEWLVPLVSAGGFVVLDDYFSWAGCTKAVHEYLAEHNLSYPIRLGMGCEYFFRIPPSPRLNEAAKSAS